MAEEAANPVAVIVAGPTATGKSALALDLAEAFDGTVINADSMQVYKGLRVLTARPDAAMLERAPHALYGVLAPEDVCSAGRWRDMALRAIAASERNGRLPIVVGGTGLYLRALEIGLSPIPPVPQEVRIAARKLHDQIGGGAFHARLAERDPVAAGRLHVNDRQRMIRAWEILEATGRSIDKWQRSSGEPGLAHRRLRLVLVPPKQDLNASCDRRVLQMLAEGAEREVERLLKRGLDPELPLMKAIGVRDLSRRLAGELSEKKAVKAMQQATRQYAKRQMTWLRTQMLAGTSEQYADLVAQAPPWEAARETRAAKRRAGKPEAGENEVIRLVSPDTWVIGAQYSESLLPRIFKILRHFLLTPSP